MNEERDSSVEAQEQSPPPPGLAGLRTSRAPQRDLWPGIESRIRARRSRAWAGRLAGLGSVAAALLLTLGVALERGGWQSAPVTAPRHGAVRIALAQPARDPALLPAVAHLHPETRALVKANLKIVDSAESQLRRALNADPDADYLKSLLASARQQRQELHIVLADAR
jgi:hypothetical protein